MKRKHLALSAVVCSLIVLSACGSGGRLVVPGEITRPPLAGPPPAGPLPAGTPVVAVTDFSYAPAAGEPGVIGRDHDQVRDIAWKGEPGRTMADLVAGAFSDRGVPAARVKVGDPVPGSGSLLVSGTVRRFEVNIRRRKTFRVETEATVAMSLTASGGGLPAPMETTVTITQTSEDVYPLPEYYRMMLSLAANAAADEGVRRLQEGGAAGTSR